jgi:hypothetical protein
MTARVGMRTPWGRADHVDAVAPGVAAVSTPGHGGIKLDRARNAKVPHATRTKGGWYEEDCQVYIVFAIFEDVRSHFKLDERAIASSLAAWLPKSYTVLREAGIVQKTAEAEKRLAENEADTRKTEEARVKRTPLRCSAMSTKDGRIHVLFRVPGETACVGYYVSKSTYEAVPIMTPASLDDFKAHGSVEPAPASYY